MPELPEVETTVRGIRKQIVSKTISRIVVRQQQLRWKIPSELSAQLTEQTVHAVTRRGKYILVATAAGHAIYHLGMSGSLRIVSNNSPAKKHDHVDWEFSDGTIMRFNDPRRFGALLWTTEDPAQHALLVKLGPEPLSNEFSADYLHRKASNRSCSIKQFIMDSHIVVGVGNIYATEALFMAGIHPNRAAGKVSLPRMQQLAAAIIDVLQNAITQGGTTLRDFVNSAGNPGYFKQSLQVYGRAGEACHKCSSIIKTIRIQQRASAYCPRCQR